MSKKVQAIIAGSVVIVLLIGAILALVLTNKPATEETPSSYSAPELITLIEGTADELEYIQVKNEKDEYKIESLGEKKWGIKAIEGYKQIDGMFDTTVSSAVGLYAKEVIEENASDLEKYGFNKPTLVAEIKLKGKDALKITLGDVSPDNSVRYLIKTGEKTVYGATATFLTNLLYSRFDYIDKTVTPALEAGQDGNPVLPSIEKISINTKDLEKPVVFEAYKSTELSPNAYTGSFNLKMTSPVTGMIAETKSQEMLTTVFGLTASSVTVLSPTAEELTKYGFDTPTATFAINYDKTSSFEVVAGAPIECQHEEGEDLKGHKHTIKSYYMMKKGTDVIYEVAVESLPWINIKRNTLLSSIAILPPILDLDGVDVVLNNNKYNIEYEKTGEGTDDFDVAKATLNSKEVDLDNAKKLLQLFYATSIQDINTAEKPTKAPDASILYRYSSGKTDKIEIYIMEDLSTIIALNGNASFTGRAGYTEVMQKNVDRLINGEDVDTDW